MNLESLIEKGVDRIALRLESAEDVFLTLCGERLAKIGIFTSARAREYLFSTDALDDQRKDLAKIKRILLKVHNANLGDINKLYQEIRAEVWNETGELVGKEGETLSKAAFTRLSAAPAMLKAARENYKATANSTATSAVYKSTINTMLNRMVGDEDRINFGQAMRGAIRELVGQGISTVSYESGYKRRLDSSVRESLMGEFTGLVQEIQGRVAGEIGSDAWEISAHAHPADDHADVQGAVFINAEYEKLQSGDPAVDVDGNHYQLDRAIGEYNCRHMAYPFMLDVSERTYSPERLREIEAQNEAGFKFQGKQMTLYEGEQLQRQNEVAQRRERQKLDVLKTVAGKDPGFSGDISRSKGRIKALRQEYDRLGDALAPYAIRKKTERTYNIGPKKQ